MTDEDIHDLIAEAIDDSFDMDWTSSDGARSVLAALKDAGLLVSAGSEALAAQDAEVKRLREALTLAANRLNRCVLDNDTGSLRFIETAEWADEALAAREPDLIELAAAVRPIVENWGSVSV